MPDGVEVVLSPVQLAAILSGESIGADETKANRLWGGLKLIGGSPFSRRIASVHVASFPYLESLLGGYFHQDCYDGGVTDDEILRDFRDTSHDYQRLGVRADIHRLLREHGEQLVDVVDQVLRPSILVGETNEEARAWLLKVASALED